MLCTTSTLAHGVNLPAHLVVVKGTNQWRGGSRGYERLPKSMMLQMIGRAGRPGFDEYGVAVVMTCEDDREYYEDTTTISEAVESSLPNILVEGMSIVDGILDHVGVKANLVVGFGRHSSSDLCRDYADCNSELGGRAHLD